MKILLLCLAAAPQGHEDEATRIGFEAALAAAETRPEVRATEARVNARAELDDGIGALATDPYVQLQPGYRFAPTENNRGFDGMVSVQQSFNLEGWGPARRRAAAAERAALGHRVLAVRRSARREAARAWLQTWALMQELELRRRMLADAQTLMQQTERRFELGMGRRVERAQASAFSAQARLDVLNAEGRLFESGLALAAACGRGEGPMFPEGPPPSPELPAGVVDQLGVEDDPEVLAARAQVDAAQERQEEAAAQDGWQLLTGLNLMHEPREQYVPSATLGLTLPVSGRNRRSTSQRGAERAAAEREQTATTLAMKRLRVEAVHEVQHTRSVSHQYDDHLLPARREEVAALTRELELGGVPLQRVINARIRLLDAEIGAARAGGQHRAAVYDLRLLVTADAEARS